MKTKRPRITTRMVDSKSLAGGSTLAWLHMKTFPNDLHADIDAGWWWVAYEGDSPVAFAGLQTSKAVENAGYLARCGVLDSHRGLGLQRRLLALREKKAKLIGFQKLVTTTFANPHSANNLIAAEYRMFAPEDPWGGEGTNYWVKTLN